MHKTILALAAALFATSASDAAPVAYQIDFTVDSLNGMVPADPDVMIGNKYFGSFVVDSGLLLSDGLNQSGLVSDFFVQFEDVIWSLNAPYPQSQFKGFRGPGGLGSASPGFDVLNGDVVNLRGGIYGSADYPFVNFSVDPDEPSGPQPGCTGAYCGNAPNAFSTFNPAGSFSGSMKIVRIPEPGPMALLMTGLIGFLASRRLTKKARSPKM
jgi:hypothetical protein